MTKQILTEEQKEKARIRAKAWYYNNIEKSKSASKSWRLANAEKEKIRKKALYEANKKYINEKNKIWAKENPERANAISRAYRKANPEKRKATVKNWEQKNKGYCAARNSKRFAAKLHRTPAWITEFDEIKIKCLYQLAAMFTKESGIAYHVDHIIPLRGKLVSGLHVSDNMRVIPAIENLQKNNRYTIV